MKKIKYYIGALLTAVFALTSCSPDSFEGADPNGIPTVEGVEPVIVVDDNLNQVTFSLPAEMKAVMPVWIFTENKGTDKERVTYSTVNGLQRIFAKAGDYEVEMKLMNRNGMSDGSVKKTFHIANTIMDYSKYLTLLTGGTSDSSKEWRMNNSVAGHFGCGEPGTTGTGWWSANPDDKASVGIYDNRLVFASDYKYTYNPGASGTMYVNCGVSGLWPEYQDSSNDYCVPMAETTTDFEFVVEGEDLFIVLPKNTPFLYVPNVEGWDNPKFRIESMTGSEINLVEDNGNIAWHYTLTSGKAAVKFDGFMYYSDYNLWKKYDEGEVGTHFWYAPGWAQIADPGYAHEDNSYTFTLPEATSDQWQAQCPLKPEGLHLYADKKYDFSVTINASNDIKGVTVKLTDINSGDNFVFAERVDVTAYEDVVFYLSDVNNLTADADCELFFDFGGNPANTTVTVKKIVVKDHANDDGTVLPADEPADTPSVEWREADNMLANMPVEISYYYAPGWSQLPNPETTAADGAYTLTLPEATSDQWQCQFTFNNTGVAISPNKKYDYRVILSANQPMKGVTVKLTQQDNDNVFLTADRHDIKEAYTDEVIELVGLSSEEITNLKIVYDFGGNPAGTEVTVKGMLLQEHKASADELEWNADDASNLWGAAMYPNSFYYAPNWAQIANPTIQEDGRKYLVSLPSATFDRWQAQVTTETEIATSADKSYDFQVLLTANKDMKGVTVKLTKVGDDSVFYTEDRHDLTAYETKAIRFVGMAGLDIDRIKLVLDFGGNPDECDVEVGEIILRESK